MAETVITVESLSKRYRLGRLWESPWTLMLRLARRCRETRRRGGSIVVAGDRIGPGETGAHSANTLWALRDVSFEVERGEVLGIVGRNGAGKSTLLKVLSRITPPTRGRATIRGRVASLLEVGTGFHPELTGRENIYLNGSVLGMTRAEIRRRFDEIVDFADIARFLDTPVKRYSSGMYVRLAFAVAAHLDPEILLVDEVLAVGDVSFQQKCLGKMQTIASSGRTVLFVSHNTGAISALCTRAIRLRDGELVDEGDAASVVGGYIAEYFVSERTRDYPRDPRKKTQIRRVEIRGLPEAVGGLLDRCKPFEIRLTYDVNEPTTEPEIVVTVERSDGTPVCQTRDIDCPGQRVDCRAPGCYEAVVRFPGRMLNTGTYVVRAAIERLGGWERFDRQDGLAFELHDLGGETMVQAGGRPRPGVLCVDLPWTTSSLGSDVGPISDRSAASASGSAADDGGLVLQR